MEKNTFRSKIVQVDARNLADHPGAICFINPKNEHYRKKVDWLKEQFRHGLRIKLLYLEDVKRPVGFIEYVSGDRCWRPVDARGYMFIHCLWTNGKKYQHQGLGTLLIREAEKDAADMHGVAVITSDKPFMADRKIFIKDGYSVVSESGKEQLLVKQFKEGPLPSIKNPDHEPEKQKGLVLVYSKQCPWVARFMDEVKPILEERNLKPEIIELKTAARAQNAPSLYGTFSLIHDGRLLADRYISTTRFVNILNKEKL